MVGGTVLGARVLPAALASLWMHSGLYARLTSLRGMNGHPALGLDVLRLGERHLACGDGDGSKRAEHGVQGIGRRQQLGFPASNMEPTREALEDRLSDRQALMSDVTFMRQLPFRHLDALVC